MLEDPMSITVTSAVNRRLALTHLLFNYLQSNNSKNARGAHMRRNGRRRGNTHTHSMEYSTVKLLAAGKKGMLSMSMPIRICIKTSKIFNMNMNQRTYLLPIL